MTKSLVKIYEDEKKRIIESCNECGLCVKSCPIVEKTDLRDLPAKEIQKGWIKFLKDGLLNNNVFLKVFSCMECFKCMENICPQGLKSLTMNEIIKWEYRKNNFLENENNSSQDNDALQKIIASIQISKEDYKRITKVSEKKSAKFLFFPGCNVYFQPEKILNALDIMNLITNDYVFLPGLDYCCGDNHLFFGEIDEAEQTINKLIEKISSYNPKTVILWCPTCQCRFYKTISLVRELLFNVVSFPQFVAEHIDKLAIKQFLYKKVTLHEPCKSAYTEVDLTGVRDILKKIPGIELKEMPRHGKNTACCGSGSNLFFPESFKEVRHERLKEAENTNSELLIDVCHYCHEVFSEEEKKYKLSVINYVNLLAEVLGINREDKFKKYKQCKNIEKIVEDAQEFIKQSPFSHEKIIEALRKVI